MLRHDRQSRAVVAHERRASPGVYERINETRVLDV